MGKGAQFGTSGTIRGMKLSRSPVLLAMTLALLGACSGDPVTTTAADATTTTQTSVPTTEAPTTTVAATTTTAPTTTTTTVAAAPPTTRVLDDPTEPELRNELLAMLAADQEERAPSEDPDAEIPPSGDAARTARLKEIIDEHGWPTWDLVGVDGATAAWAIAQHSDQDVDFQREALALLEVAAAEGNGSLGEVAYLTDRVALNSGELQVYGTQLGGCVDGKLSAAPMIDEDQVDERRAAVGLGTLKDYFAEFGDVTC